MALRGNLRDFSLPDVFQLVTLSGKTGVLRIRREDAEGSVWFRDGAVFFAQSDWHHEVLGQRLVTAGKITPSALGKALDLQKSEPEGGRRLGQILVDEGYISENVLEAFVQEQIQDTIFDLFRWDEGDFDFETLDAAPEEDIGLSVSIENVVMEGSRRLEEWTRIKKKIPSMSIVFKMATAPGEGTFDISLKPTEWSLLLKVDGTRTVSELAHDMARTDFEVARIIYGLFSAGLLEVASDEEVERLRAERQKLEASIAAARPEPAPAAPAEVAAAAVAGPAEVEAVPAVPAADEPAFLSAGPSAGVDEAALQEMMGAVLEAPAAEAPAPAEAVAPPQETVAPPSQEVTERVESEPPPFLAPPPIEIEPEPVVEIEPAPVLEQVVEIEPEPVPEPEPEPEPEPATIVAEPLPAEIELSAVEAPPPAPAAGVYVFEDAAPPPAEAPTVEAVEITEPAPAPVVGPAEPSAPEPEVLGAPSVPDDTGESELAGLLETLETVHAAPEEDDGFMPTVAEPASVAAPSSAEGAPKTGDFAADLMALGLGELPEAPVAEQHEPTIAELEAAAQAADSGEATIADIERAARAAEEAAPAGATETADLTDLLASLGGPDESAVLGTVGVGEMGAGADAGTGPSGGVISTDAFLEDFGSSDVSFSSGLGDEITALTGGGGGRQRPNASVSKLPEGDAAGQMLHRDSHVDKALLMRIIEGVKQL